MRKEECPDRIGAGSLRAALSDILRLNMSDSPMSPEFLRTDPSESLAEGVSLRYELFPRPVGETLDIVGEDGRK